MDGERERESERAQTMANKANKKRRRNKICKKQLEGVRVYLCVCVLCVVA